MKRIHLDAEDLALGHTLAQSKKNREQLLDHSYNRYVNERCFVVFTCVLQFHGLRRHRWSSEVVY